MGLSACPDILRALRGHYAYALEADGRSRLASITVTSIDKPLSFLTCSAACWSLSIASSFRSWCLMSTNAPCSVLSAFS